MGKWKSMVGKVTHVVLLRRQVARKRGGVRRKSGLRKLSTQR